ncbi:MAG: glycosyltransferase family 4 protein [Lentisphaeria bacterium]|nr:glycosyltransferase family 4 protein [Lentisphaeria bacterium]
MSCERKMKICHVITRMIVGGAQENTLLTIKGHIEKGHEVVLVTGFSPGREGELLKNVEMPPFKIVEIPEMVREVSPVKDLKALRKLREYFKKEKFDVVHTHSSKAGIIGRIAARQAGVPVVVHTVHGQAFHAYEKPWKKLLYITAERIAAKYCDKIYAVAQAMIDQCVDAKVAPREKYMVVYSGMDTAAFANARRNMELRQKLGIPENAKVIVTVARLFPMKGYEEMLPAAARLVKEFPDLHFLPVGDGPMYDELQKQIADLGLSGNFHFAGLVPPHEVCDYIAQADLLWHLSLHEGLPRAVVQALAVGIPAIGYKLDGTPEVVLNGKTGYVTAPQDVDAVVARSRELLNDAALRAEMGKNGKDLVIERFAWRRMADILEKEFLMLLNAKSGR